jgi:hypothetical protein
VSVIVGEGERSGVEYGKTTGDGVKVRVAGDSVLEAHAGRQAARDDANSRRIKSWMRNDE